MAISEAALGGIISAAGSVAGAGASAIATGNLNKKNRQWQEEQSAIQRQWNESMADKQNAWNYEMWLKEQEYNNPENQLERLRNAGLNPLYYGLDGNATSQAQPAAQPLGYDRASQFNVANPVSAGIDAAAKIAQISNIQANTAKQKEETLSETQRRERIQADVLLAKQELENMKANEKLTKSQSAEIDKRIGWLDRLNEATTAEKEASAALSKSQKERIDKLLEGEQLLQAANLQDFEKKWSKIDAEIGKISKETGILQKDIENYALNHASNGFMGTGLSLQNLFRGLSGLDAKPGQENKFSDGNDWRDIANSGQ